MSVTPSYRETFLGEARAALDTLDLALTGKDGGQMRSARASLHSLKGAAAAFGMMELAQMAAGSAGLCDAVVDKRDEPDALDLLARARDVMTAHLDDPRRAEADVRALLADLRVRAPGALDAPGGP
ncbi:MAG: Hpt domain-containing protein, partial [Alphaproteobacteria bacterium]|nr:Hpt domain-containing protein [Alphaproteobacteria bacterium]